MKISVAMATYNGEKYIKEQLQSILQQTMPVDEIIISDDGSSDATLVYIDEFISAMKIGGVHLFDYLEIIHDMDTVAILNGH